MVAIISRLLFIGLIIEAIVKFQSSNPANHFEVVSSIVGSFVDYWRRWVSSESLTHHFGRRNALELAISSSFWMQLTRTELWEIWRTWTNFLKSMHQTHRVNRSLQSKSRRLKSLALMVQKGDNDAFPWKFHVEIVANGRTEPYVWQQSPGHR